MSVLAQRTALALRGLVLRAGLPGFPAIAVTVIGLVETGALEYYTDLADYPLRAAARAVGTFVVLFLADCVLSFKDMSARFALVFVEWHVLLTSVTLLIKSGRILLPVVNPTLLLFLFPVLAR